MPKSVKKKKIIKKKNTKRKKNTKGKKKEEFSNEIWTYKTIPFLSMFDEKYDERKYVREMDTEFRKQKIIMVISTFITVVTTYLGTKLVKKNLRAQMFDHFVKRTYYTYTINRILHEYNKSITVPKEIFDEEKENMFMSQIKQMFAVFVKLGTTKLTFEEFEVKYQTPIRFAKTLFDRQCRYSSMFEDSNIIKFYESIGFLKIQLSPLKVLITNGKTWEPYENYNQYSYNRLIRKYYQNVGVEYTPRPSPQFGFGSSEPQWHKKRKKEWFRRWLMHFFAGLGINVSFSFISIYINLLSNFSFLCNGLTEDLLQRTYDERTSRAKGGKEMFFLKYDDTSTGITEETKVDEYEKMIKKVAIRRSDVMFHPDKMLLLNYRGSRLELFTKEQLDKAIELGKEFYAKSMSKFNQTLKVDEKNPLADQKYNTKDKKSKLFYETVGSRELSAIKYQIEQRKELQRQITENRASFNNENNEFDIKKVDFDKAFENRKNVKTFEQYVLDNYGIVLVDKEKDKIRKKAFGKRKRKKKFGKKTTKKVKKKVKIPVSLKKKCKSLKIRLTLKKGGKRVYKSEAMLKKQCKKAIKRRKK